MQTFPRSKCKAYLSLWLQLKLLLLVSLLINVIHFN